MEFKHQILNVKLKFPYAYDIGKSIIAIYEEKINIPILSKYIIDPNHTLGITFTNLANNLSFVDLLYLFNNRLENINNCGCRLQINTYGENFTITYNDLSLFIFNNDGEIEKIENPKYANKHMIGGNMIDNIEQNKSFCGSSDILLFSSIANIEDNLNLHKNILKMFPDYTIKDNIKEAIYNSKLDYDRNPKFKKPFNIWGTSDGGDDEFDIFIRFNHYLDVNQNNIKSYIIKIFTQIGEIFDSININQINTNYENKLIDSGAYLHKNNYNFVQVFEKLEKNKFDILCKINNIHGINGNYLISEKDELVNANESMTSTIKYAISEIINNIETYFNTLH